ncbi:MAG: hypothetical protein IJM46_10475 [Oscillospiraceae bacterium]|nr:hypothetical protein [Oscillospiraceae bacterium]
MAKANEIKNLEDLINFGVKTKGYEDETYLYIWANDPERNYYDSSFYRYNKKSKTLEWHSSMISFFPTFDKVNKVEFDPDYLKQYL